MAPTTNNNKFSQQIARSSNNLSDVKASEKYDISVIAESLDLSHKNVAQIAFVLENGSDDVKNLLLNECNIIYECRVCVSMFRSFGNFVAHKRLYCKGHECEQMVLYDPSWFKPKNDEMVEMVQEEKKVDISDSFLLEANKTIQTENKTLNSDQTNQVKSLIEVSNKKRKLNTIISNVNSLGKLQNSSEKTIGIPESSFYSNQPTRNTSTPSKDIEKFLETSKIQPKRLTRQCLKKATTSLRSQEISKSSNSKSSIINNSKVKQSTRRKLSSSVDFNGVEQFQQLKSTNTNEPLIIHRHFHHHHQPEPISSPSALSTTNMVQMCAK